MGTLRQTFEAQDAQGNSYVLLVLEEQQSAATRGNPNAKIPGMRSIETDNGLKVNRLAQGQYEIVETGVVLRSSAPDAP